MNLRRLYPLSGYPQQRQLWSWISFDVANQCFALLVNTLLFPIFLSQMVVRNDAIDDRIWALAYGSSMLLTAALSPLLGAAADARAWKKRLLVGSGLMCGTFTCGLALIQPGQVWLAVLLYVPANFAFAIGENFLASFLPGLARRDQMGRVSGFSWAVAYGAALLLLILTAVAMGVFKLETVDRWHPFFMFSGLWFFAFAIPTMFWLREPHAASFAGPDRGFVRTGLMRLGESFRNARQHRDLALLLAASLFYGTGVSVVVFFAGKLAAEFGFTQIDLVIFVGVLTVSGIFGTILPTFSQDRIGHRRSVLILLIVWLATVLGFAWYAHLHEAHAARMPDAPFPVWPLWLIGNLLGFGLGSLGSANRAFVGYLAPPGREAETFGMWGLVWKLSAIMTFPFAWVKDTLGNSAALLVLAGFLTIGLALTLFINEKRGYAARGD